MSATVRVNGVEQPLAKDAATLAALLRTAGIEADARGVAVAVDGSVVARRNWSTTTLSGGEDVEIVKLFAGG